MKKILNHFGKKLQSLKQIRDDFRKQQNRTFDISGKVENEEKKEALELQVSSHTIVKIILIVALFLIFKNVIIQLQSILIITAICLFLAIGLSPILDYIEKKIVYRPIAILVLYTGFLGVLGLLFVKLIPIIAEQLQSMAFDLRNFVIKSNIQENSILAQFFNITNLDPQEVQQFLTQNISSIAGNLQSIAGSTFVILSGVFQGVFNFIFALVLLFFILMEREQIGRFSLLLVSPKRRGYLQKKFMAVQSKMAEWFHGQIILMVCMGGFMYLGMKILELTLGMKYAATIGLVAGIMEIFPYLGVFITGILCVLIAVNISWVLVLAVVIWIGISQFLEGNFLVPLVMEKATGLSSVVVILAVAIGGILGSAVGGVSMAILGMIFSVPLAASIAIFVEEYANRKN